MAHQLAPSVNCSLDEIDLSALKVYTIYIGCGYNNSFMFVGILHFLVIQMRKKKVYDKFL